MPGIRSDVDPDGLLEYSVVFTDRSLNHMSQSFQGVMRDISETLKSVYNTTSIAIVPGGGTYGMEAVARQFAKIGIVSFSAMVGLVFVGAKFSMRAIFQRHARF